MGREELSADTHEDREVVVVQWQETRWCGITVLYWQEAESRKQLLVRVNYT